MVNNKPIRTLGCNHDIFDVINYFSISLFQTKYLTTFVPLILKHHKSFVLRHSHYVLLSDSDADLPTVQDSRNDALSPKCLTSLFIR